MALPQTDQEKAIYWKERAEYWALLYRQEREKGEKGMGGSLDIEAIRARVEAATEGPWHDTTAFGKFYIYSSSVDDTVFVGDEDETFYQDREFATKARTDIPALLARVEALEAERAAADKYINALVNKADAYTREEWEAVNAIGQEWWAAKQAALLNGTQQGSESEESEGVTRQRRGCKHLNCTVSEYAREYLEWSVTSGVIDEEGIRDYGSPSETVTVHCFDCGMRRRYSKYTAPKWLHNLLVDAEIIDEEKK